MLSKEMGKRQLFHNIIAYMSPQFLKEDMKYLKGHI